MTRLALLGVLAGIGIMCGTAGQARAEGVATPHKTACAQAWAQVAHTIDPSQHDRFLTDHGACPEAAAALYRRDALLARERSGRLPPIRLRGGLEVGAARYQPIGKLLGPQMRPMAVDGGYAMLALRNAGAKEHLLCEAFNAKTGPFEPAGGDEGAPFTRPVYWPLKRTAMPDGTAPCTELLAGYDFTRALVRIDDMRALLTARGIGEARGLSGAGPFVLVWRNGGETGGVFDFSSVPIDEMSRQIDAFLLYASLGADAWDRDRFETASLRQWIRNYLQTAGQPLTENIAAMFGLPTMAQARDTTLTGTQP